MSRYEWDTGYELGAGPEREDVPAAPGAAWPGDFAPATFRSPGRPIWEGRGPASRHVVVVRGVDGPVSLHRRVAGAWSAMVAAARADGIANPLLLPVSGNRGGALYGSGRVLDLYLGRRINGSDLLTLRRQPVYRWLLLNAERFGFYPYDRLPGHWEYNHRTSPALEAETGGAAEIDFGALARNLFGAIVGAGEAAAAIAAGERDESRLTDILFNARHPERGRRRIQPGETQLVYEWTAIRDSIVRRALQVVRAPRAPASRQLPAAPAPITATAPVLAAASRYTLPANPAQLRPAARTQINAVPLFPGDRVFDIESRLITDVAARPDGWVYMANWYAGLLVPTLWPIAKALTQCSARGGTIRALFWDGSLHQLDPVIRRVTSPLSVVGGAVSSVLRPELDRLIREYLTRYTNHAANNASATFLNYLPNAAARLDDATLTLGSHHQKILVVGNNERTVAVIGGVDLNQNRVLRVDGGGTPLFDISLQLDGQAAEDVADIFERRWRADAGRRSVALPARRRPVVAPPATGATVQVGVNFGCRQPLSDVPHAIRGGSELIKNVLGNCQSFFYAEDQYGVGNRELEAAITQAFANGARYGIVVLAGTAVSEDIPEIAFRRYQFWSRFPQTGRNLLVFERLGDDSTPAGPHAYVHSKLLLVDDRAACIGSLNMNRRSWNHDSEIAAVITDVPSVIRDLRLGVWGAHLAVVGSDEIRDPGAAFAVWQAAHSGARRMPRIRPLSFATRPPRASDNILRRVTAVSSPLVPFLGIGPGDVLDLSLGAVREAIDSVLDEAYDLIFDPSGPASC